MTILTILGVIISTILLIFDIPLMAISFKDPKESRLDYIIENAIEIDDNYEVSEEELANYKKKIIFRLRAVLVIVFLISTAILTAAITALI